MHDRTAGTTVRVPLAIETLIPQLPPPSPRSSVTVMAMRLDASGRWVALLAAETTTSGAIGAKIVSLIYDRVAGRTLVVDAVDRISLGGGSILAFSGDGSMVESNIYFYSRVGYSLVRLDRTTGFAIRSFSGQYASDELSFTGDVAILRRIQSRVRDRLR